MSDSDFNFKKLNILIVGMGLIGASIAMALRKNDCMFVNGIDVNPSVLERLIEDKIINHGFTSVDIALENADLIIICLYPFDTAKFLIDYKNSFKKGSVVTDVSGVKADLITVFKDLDDVNFSFVGGHPMAGKEVGGYENAEPNLFNGANFIITPFKSSTPESIKTIEILAKTIGCSSIKYLSPDEHDLTIAFTSQLAHVIAVAMCKNSLEYRIEGFTGGSFRDLTRVAEINENLWGGVLNTNSDKICKVIDSFINNLDEIKGIIEKKDNSIYEYLRDAKKIKRGL